MSLALDEPTQSDEVFDVNGFQIIASKDLMEQAQPVTIDYQGMGFQIRSNLNMGGSGGGCSGCGSTSEGGSCSH